jgi:hypothetical protein
LIIDTEQVGCGPKSESGCGCTLQWVWVSTYCLTILQTNHPCNGVMMKKSYCMYTHCALFGLTPSKYAWHVMEESKQPILLARCCYSCYYDTSYCFASSYKTHHNDFTSPAVPNSSNSVSIPTMKTIAKRLSSTPKCSIYDAHHFDLFVYASFLRRRMSTSFLFMWVWWTEKNPDLMVRQRTENEKRRARKTHHASWRLQ